MMIDSARCMCSLTEAERPAIPVSATQLQACGRGVKCPRRMLLMPHTPSATCYSFSILGFRLPGETLAQLRKIPSELSRSTRERPQIRTVCAFITGNAVSGHGRDASHAAYGKSNASSGPSRDLVLSSICVVVGFMDNAPLRRLISANLCSARRHCCSDRGRRSLLHHCLLS